MNCLVLLVYIKDDKFLMHSEKILYTCILFGEIIYLVFLIDIWCI